MRLRKTADKMYPRRPRSCTELHLHYLLDVYLKAGAPSRIDHLRNIAWDNERHGNLTLNCISNSDNCHFGHSGMA